MRDEAEIVQKAQEKTQHALDVGRGQDLPHDVEDGIVLQRVRGGNGRDRALHVMPIARVLCEIASSP